MSKQKLELTWIGKEKRPQLEPRILLEDPARSYHAKQRFSDADIFDNRLIFGDNLLALKALEQEFAGKVKCVFIDPPYNTGSAFTHYDDGVEHSIWLGLIRDRLELLRALISEEGSIWITIDDAEGHYLKVICDEIFGRLNFLGTVTWQKTTSIHNNATAFSSATDLVLVYAKEITKFTMGRAPRSDRNASDYSNVDDDPRGAWASSPLHVSLTSGQRGKQYAMTGKSSGLFPIISPHGEEILPPKGRAWAYSIESIQLFEKQGLIWWGKDGRNQPRLKRFIQENKEGVVPGTLWLSEDVGHNQEAKAENANLLPELATLFSTPKPERLLKRVLELATNPGDLVLDSFAGSGTTGAVAHKMGRRWIMVELGDHCHTHIIPRLKKVIDGQDPGGVTEATGWKGGGGFRYYSLAPSLIVNDRWGNPVINPEYNPAQLSEALCKLEAFTYAPSETRWWQHGHSSERDFIVVTTQNLSADQLQALADEVGEEQSLLVCCAAYHGVTAAKAADRWPNLTLKKIPKMVLSRCEWGHDDYSLNVANLPMAQEEPVVAPAAKATRVKKQAAPQPGLFGDAGEEF
ncbi:site-specific DNA-methyltransferase [Limnohabitans sp. 2KL-17]|uniref:site-specific DNA-methyltransferase n=1 Tax=Limnohabitans sp. 2KL-17 TaxID=1100704 RepID=UPI000D3B9650|nr:site-specific DNA-methyltransferase [Limnohabitans sp. 2KL-17]PUE62814.1 site-specific DNA-methyltransferase [Limnohabitans sp. 2KL-17]